MSEITVTVSPFEETGVLTEWDFPDVDSLAKRGAGADERHSNACA